MKILYEIFYFSTSEDDLNLFQIYTLKIKFNLIKKILD